MLIILRILAVTTIFILGVLLGLTGLGVLSISRSRLNKLMPNHIAVRPIVLGTVLIALGITLLYTPFNMGSVTVTDASAFLVICALVGLVFVFGHIRIDKDGKITLRKRPRWDKDRRDGGMGIVSRLIGVFLFLPSVFLLVASLGLFGLTLTSNLVELVLKAVSTALSTVLVKLIVGNLGEQGKKIEGWVLTVAAVLLFVGLLAAFPGAIIVGTPPATTPTSTPTQGTPEPGPQITGFDVTKQVLSVGEQTQITVHATGNALTYRWSAEYGRVEPDDWCAQSTVLYTAPDFTTFDTVHVVARDANGNTATAETDIQVVDMGATASPTSGTHQPGPQITALYATKQVLPISEQTSITVQATGTGLTYRWSADYGTVEPDDWCAQSTALYTAPDFTTFDSVHVVVRDSDGNTATAETNIQVVK